MQRVLPWTLLIVGLLVGYVVGLGSRPVPGGPVPTQVPTAQGPTKAPQDLLPFALQKCEKTDCVGEVDLFTGIKWSGGVTHTPAPHGSPSPLPSSHPFSIISNMSVNKAGLARDIADGATHRIFSITIPEDIAGRGSEVKQRLQTLYIVHDGEKASYLLSTCVATKPQGDDTEYCDHAGTAVSHN